MKTHSTRSRSMMALNILAIFLTALLLSPLRQPAVLAGGEAIQTPIAHPFGETKQHQSVSPGNAILLAVENPVYLPLITNGPARFPVLINANFELGHSAWTETSTFFPNGLIYQQGVGGAPAAHSGGWLTWMGGAVSEVSDLSQQVTIPPGTDPIYLNFYYQISSEETNCSQVTPSDGLYLLVNNIQTDGIVVCNAYNTGPNWTAFYFAPDLSAYAGQTVTLHIKVVNNDTLVSNVFLDTLYFSDTVN